jgi:predicted GNAT superfamily acetyltransferase
MEIRDLRSGADLQAVEQLQREVWGFSDLDVVSGSIFRVMLEIGGILVGAFDDRNELVAFNSGFTGYRKGQLEIHSDMLAVRHGHRDRGLGYALKMAQRERTLAMGIDRITWTFDPLRSRNAYFNFRKLGALSNEYHVNFYGESTSSFLHSIGTDRLWITWMLKGELCLPAGQKETVEIPREIDALSMQEQWEWRMSTRARFQELLSSGYCITDYDGNGRYTLQRGSLEDFTQ